MFTLNDFPTLISTLHFCILTQLIFLQSSEEHAHEVHCSRERSRAAYKIIEEVSKIDIFQI